MATLLKTLHFGAPPSSFTPTLKPLKSSPFRILTFTNTLSYPSSHFSLFSHHYSPILSTLSTFVTLSASEDAVETETETETPLVQENADEAINGETSEDSASEEIKPEADAAPTSPVLTALQLYKEALETNDEAKLAEVEAFFKSLEDEKNALDRKVLSLSEDFSVERERVLRISADFDNFRKRTERERLSLVTDAQGELIENFLPVVDNFERAKTQIKIVTEAEQKISNSYQSIYKQFFEILSSVGVVPVDTVGKAFDPALHEAIMREDSAEYDEDVVIEEYRKGFKLGDRLLRPSMVKVSAGPGPEKPEPSVSPVEEESVTETDEVVDDADDSADQTSA